MVRLVIAVLAGCASGLALEAHSKPSASRSHLDGTWQLETPIVPENPKNWERPLKPPSMDPRLAPCIQPSPQRVPTEVSGVLEPCLRQWGPVHQNDPVKTVLLYGQTLIAESLKLHISTGPKAVTIGDDFFGPTSFTTSGGGHRLTVRMSLYRSRPGPYTTVVVKTRWEADALVQDLAGTYGNGFKLRRVFTLAEDGKRLLMLIHVEKPRIDPPVADMTRAYVRDGR